MPQVFYLSILAGSKLQYFPDYKTSSDSQTPNNNLVAWSLTIFVHSLALGQRQEIPSFQYPNPQIPAIPEALNANSVSSARQDAAL